MRFSTSLIVLLLSLSSELNAEGRVPGTIRVATFNIQELSWKKLRPEDGEQTGKNPQLQAAAQVIQTVRPDILLINEIDYWRVSGAEPAATAQTQVDNQASRERADAAAPFGQTPEERDFPMELQKKFLNVSQGGKEPIRFGYLFYAPTNTGEPSGLDFNSNGKEKQTTRTMPAVMVVIRVSTVWYYSTVFLWMNPLPVPSVFSCGQTFRGT